MVCDEVWVAFGDWEIRQNDQWETIDFYEDSVIPPESCETPGVRGDQT